MESIVLKAKHLFSLESEITELDSLLKLSALLEDLPENTDELDVFQAIESYLKGRLPFATEFEGLLSSLDLSKDDLNLLWSKLEEKVEEKVPDRYRSLLKTFAEIGTGSTSSENIDWPFLDGNNEVISTKIGKSNVDLGVGFSADANLSVTAYGKVPDTIPSHQDFTDHGAVGLELKGKLGGNLSAAIPFQWGGVSADVGAEKSVGVTYVFKHKASRRFGKALINDLKGLPLPFDAESIVEAFDNNPNLHSVGFKSAGVFSANGALQIGVAQELKNTVSIENFGIQAGFDLQVNSGLVYQIYRESNASNEQYLVVKVDKNDGRNRGFSAGVGVEINAQGNALAVNQKLIEQLDHVEPLIRVLNTGALEDSDSFLDDVYSRLEQISDHEVWAKVVAVMKGDDSIPGIVDTIRGSLYETINEEKVGMQSRFKSAVEGYVDDVLGEHADSELYQIAKPYADQIVQVITSEVNKYITEETDRIIERITQIPDLAGLLKSSVEKAIGIQINPANLKEDVLGKLQPIKNILIKYQKHLTRLSDVVAAASKANVKASIAYESRKQNNTNLLMTMRIKWQALDDLAQEIQYLLAGDSRPIIAAFNGGNGNIQFVDGLLKTAVSSGKSLGFAVTLLDFKLSAQSLLDTETIIEKDLVSGDVTVTSKAELSKTSSFFGDVRNVKFVNAVRLSNANILPFSGVSLSINRQEDELEKDELNDFLSGLELAGLISKERLEYALNEVFLQHMDAAQGSISDAEILLGFNLSSDELKTLVAVTNDDEGKRQVFSAVKEAVEDLGLIEDKQIVEFAKYKDEVTDLDSLLDFAFDDYFFHDKTARTRIRSKTTSSRANNNRRPKFKRLLTTMNIAVNWVENTERLHRALVLMNEVLKAGSNQTESFYEDKQKEIAKNISDWVKVRHAFTPFNNDDIRNETLALMMVISDLIGIEDARFTPLKLMLTYRRHAKTESVELLA